MWSRLTIGFKVLVVKILYLPSLSVVPAGGRRKILRNGYLIIDPVSREDRGNYSCMAENIYGSDISYGWLEVLRESLMGTVVTAYFVITCSFIQFDFH